MRKKWYKMFLLSFIYPTISCPCWKYFNIMNYLYLPNHKLPLMKIFFNIMNYFYLLNHKLPLLKICFNIMNYLYLPNHKLHMLKIFFNIVNYFYLPNHKLLLMKMFLKGFQPQIVWRSTNHNVRVSCQTLDMMFDLVKCSESV